MEQLTARKIALRYAKALIETAEEQNQLEAVTQDIQFLQRLCLEVPELNGFFANPGIPAHEKQAVIQGQFKKGVSPLVGNLLEMLLENGRIALLWELIITTLDLLNARNGIAKAEVTVPVAIDDKLEKEFRKTLEKLFDYQQVDLTVKVDPAILAGAIVRIGDKIIDGSYHGKLEMLKRQVG